mgnify:CR=1 FL=1
MTPLHNAGCYSRNRCDALPQAAGQYVVAMLLIVEPERPSVAAEVWLGADVKHASCSAMRLSPDLHSPH